MIFTVHFSSFDEFTFKVFLTVIVDSLLILNVDSLLILKNDLVLEVFYKIKKHDTDKVCNVK